MLTFKKLKDFANFWKKIKTAWENKTPRKKWYLLYRFVQYLGDLIQLRILSTNKVGLIGYSPVMFLVINISLAMYTFYYYVSRGSYVEIIPCFCVYGAIVPVRRNVQKSENVPINSIELNFQSYASYFTCINKYRFSWNKLTKISGEYIYCDDHQPSVYNSICSKCIDQSLRAYVIRVMVILLSFVGAVLGPFLSFIHDGSLVTLYELRIPYCDQDPYMEYVINLIWQFMISAIGLIGLLINEGAFSLINDTLTVSSKITSYEFSQLSNVLETQNKDQEHHGKSRRQLIKNFMNILYMNEYGMSRTINM